MDKSFTIYFDLDGVCADFEAKWYQHFPEIDMCAMRLGERVLYNKIKDVDNYWEDIPFIPSIMPLWDYCYSKYDVQTLSAPLECDKERCITGKNTFLDNHLGDYEFKRNYYSHEKKCLKANANTLLIDDKESNVEEFRAAGGLAILHETHNTQRTMDVLQYGFGL